MPSSKKSHGQCDRRLTERRNPASNNLDHMTALEIVRLMNREDSKVAPAVARELTVIARAVDAIVDRMRQGGRMIYIGAGTSGRLGVLDASECPPTFGVSPRLVRSVIAGGRKAITASVEGAEDDRARARRDLERLRVGKADAIVGIAASGTTPYVLAALAHARRRQALTIGLTANRRSPLALAAEILIAPKVGPEVLAGSTRLKAGTAQKMVLNMLSTAVMVRLGHAYTNLMIDLGLANKKLRERAKWILAEASGRDMSQVEHTLRQSGHDLRLALVMLKRGVSMGRARAYLQEAEGHLRQALNE